MFAVAHTSKKCSNLKGNMAVDFCRERHKNLPQNEQSKLSLAKMRWKMLAKAFQEGKVQESENFPGSVRQFSTFSLISMTPIDDFENDNAKKRLYYCTCDEEPRLKLKIRLLSNKISYEDLTGFDNTGNVCIWPSEEVMTYYCMKNKELFCGKSVCELGGGMACLSSIAIAAVAGAKEVFATDGNIRCIENVQYIIDQNIQCFGTTHVVSRLLRWDIDEDLTDSRARFDVVLCADCLYFNEGRIPLSCCIWKILKDNGLAVILAPPRGRTFQQFVEIVQKKFYVERLMVYDTHVWELNCKLKESNSDVYNEDLHYPQMLILRKI